VTYFAGTHLHVLDNMETKELILRLMKLREEMEKEKKENEER